jgi:hypothetical protein
VVATVSLLRVFGIGYAVPTLGFCFFMSDADTLSQNLKLLEPFAPSSEHAIMFTIAKNWCAFALLHSRTPSDLMLEHLDHSQSMSSRRQATRAL